MVEDCISGGVVYNNIYQCPAQVFDLQSMAKANKATATKLVGLRDELQTLILKIKMGEQSVYSLTDEFEALQKRVHVVYSDAPKTTDAAVKMAEEALKIMVATPSLTWKSI